MNIANSILSTQKIFLYVASFLLIGLFTIKAYFSIPLFWFLAFLILIFFLSKILFVNNDPMGVILILFFLSHFSYLENQGGLWNILAFTIFSIILFRKKRRTYFKSDPLTFSLLILLFLFNLIGWIFISDAELILRIQGFIMLCSYILMFLFISNIKLTPFQLRRFFDLLVIISIYVFFASINQRIGIIDSYFPFLPPKAISEGVIALTTNSNSTFGNSELYGEYSVLILLLTMSVSKSQKLVRLFFSKTYYPLIIISLSFIGTFLSGSRASIILAILAVIIVFLQNIVNFNNSIKFFRNLIFVIIFTLILSFLGLDFGYLSTKVDFQKIDQSAMSIQSIISGESINRYELFQFALDRLNSQNWFFGNGLGPLESNLISWWGYSSDTPYIDFHNLYYSLPMIYGYAGSFIFLFFIVRIIILNRKYSKKIKIAYYLKPLLKIMPFFWILFFLDEWKITMLRNSNYHMLIWMFLGLNMALIKTIKTIKIEK